MTKYGIKESTVKWAKYLAGLLFNNQLSKNDDRKKLSYKMVKEANMQSYCVGVTEISQKLLVAAKEIEKENGNKFELLVGEIELLLLENLEFFKSTWGHTKFMTPSIEDIKQRIEASDVKVTYENNQTTS